MTAKTKTIIKHVRLASDTQLIFEKHMKDGKFLSEGEFIRACIYAYDEDKTPAAYTKNLDPVEKAKAKIQAAEILAEQKEEAKISTQRKLCDVLEGTVGDDENGKLVCRYTRYDEIAGQEIKTQTVEEPLAFLNPDLVEAQYITIEGYRGGKAKAKILGILKEQSK